MQDGAWEPDHECRQVENRYLEDFKEKMSHTIAHVGTELDTRDTEIRRSETNFGNMICDLIRTEWSTDFAIYNAGTFRKNALIESGPISLMVIQESFPFNEPNMVVKMSGALFLECLEWSVSAYPSEEGRFPQISGFSFYFDPSKPVGKRIFKDEILPDAGAEFDINAQYTVAINGFMYNGGDGYSVFKKEGVKTLVDEETGLGIMEIFKNFCKLTRTDVEIPAKRALTNA